MSEKEPRGQRNMLQARGPKFSLQHHMTPWVLLDATLLIPEHCQYDPTGPPEQHWSTRFEHKPSRWVGQLFLWMIPKPPYSITKEDTTKESDQKELGENKEILGFIGFLKTRFSKLIKII